MYKEIIEHYGKTNQKIVAIEELSELQKEITKDLRGLANNENLLEEIADVEIMLDQLKIIYDLSFKDLNKMKERKLERIWKKANSTSSTNCESLPSIFSKMNTTWKQALLPRKNSNENTNS